MAVVVEYNVYHVLDSLLYMIVLPARYESVCTYKKRVTAVFDCRRKFLRFTPIVCGCVRRNATKPPRSSPIHGENGSSG